MEIVKNFIHKYSAIQNVGILSILFSGIAIFGVIKLWKLIRKKQVQQRWARKAKEVREARDRELERFVKLNQEKITKERIDEIVSQNLTELAANISLGVVKSEEAVLAYALRAATIGKELGYITNINFENALKQAREIDLKIQKGEEKLPQLAGVPVSIKDHILIKGLPITCGITAYHNFVKDYNADIVEVLIKQGAIPFVLSNVPQAVLSIESVNPLWGSAKNPWDKSRTTGGSSGGEAGLISTRCSPFGIGTDLAGSIRIPSAFCGTYGFKPTSNRISKNGMISSLSGTDSMGLPIQVSIGPLGRTMDDIIFIVKNLFGEFKEDPYTDNRPFDDQLFNTNKKFKIGYIYDIEFDTATDIKQKIEKIVKKLQEQGYELVPFEFPKLKKLLRRGLQIIINSNIHPDMLQILQGEKLESIYQGNEIIHNTPYMWQKRLLAAFVDKKLGTEIIKNRQVSRPELINKLRQWLELRKEFVQYFKNNNFDGIICPTMPMPSFKEGKGGEYISFTNFCFMFNLVDMPAGSIPIGLVENTSYSTSNKNFFNNLIEESLKDSKGLPVALQVGTLPKTDELCLRLMKEIDSIVRFDLNEGKNLFNNLKNLSNN